MDTITRVQILDTVVCFSHSDNIVTQCWSERFFLYHVEHEFEFGVCVCECVSGFERGWAYPSEVKKKGKENFFFPLRCQITRWKAFAATKCGLEIMLQRDQAQRFFRTYKF